MGLLKSHNAGLIQSVILKRSEFPTVQEAKKWLTDHNYKYLKTDITPHYFRFRQLDPEPLEAHHYRFRQVPIGKSGFLVIAYRP
jgi:hypothetical protein